MKKISLLVSIYNSGEWIESRLNNLLQMTQNIDAEIICINADSPDPLDHSVPSSMQSDKIKYFKCPARIGIYDAWNDAIRISNAQYLANANTDDISGPFLYKSLCDFLDSNNNYGVAYSSWYSIGYHQRTWTESASCGVVCPGHFNGDFDVGQIGHFPVWRKSLHDTVGYFDGSLTALGDADFWSRVYFKTNSGFHWCNMPLAAYRWRDGQNAWHRFISPEQWGVFHNKVNEYKNGSVRN